MKRVKTIPIALPCEIAELDNQVRAIGEHHGHWHDAIVKLTDDHQLVIEYEEDDNS